jgi:hypothetical protein
MIVADKTLEFEGIVRRIRRALVAAEIIDTGEWQAIQGAPQARMAEVEDITFRIYIPIPIADLQTDLKPNLPWAEDHFQERVSGKPFNPPPSSAWWPFAVQGNAAHKQNEKFSHTYPERLWPLYAGQAQEMDWDSSMETPFVMHGIRYDYGDLSDVVELLKARPGTRQAYVPIWFPEDGWAAGHGLRVPCTLGYHLLLRNNKLKIVYYMRSCDFLRHFRDDVYMAARLCQWVAEKIGAEPGALVMHISSMHVFESDVSRLRYVVEHE